MLRSGTASLPHHRPSSAEEDHAGRGRQSPGPLRTSSTLGRDRPPRNRKPPTPRDGDAIPSAFYSPPPRRVSHSNPFVSEPLAAERSETNLLLKMDKKPKPCSGDPGKIAQDEDEDGYSDKKPLTVVEDEHSDKIGAHATDEDRKQEQGRARGDVEDLLNMDDETLAINIVHFSELLNYVSHVPDYTPASNDDELIQLHEQLALYRIRGYELKMNRKVAKLDDVDLKREYPPSKLYDKGFFKHYEERLEWYFDPKLYWHTRFGNYQRLVLRDGGYLEWDFYRTTLNTYEEDVAYVQYFEALAKKTKWIEDYLGNSTIEMSFKAALLEVNEPETIRDICRRKDRYDTHVAGIDKMASDDEARQLILEAVIRMDPKPKYYLDYARKKLDIAKDIGLV